MAVTNALVSFRTREHIKSEAYQVIEQYGLTPSQVFNLFLNQIAKTRTIPIDLSYLRPNEETRHAIEELESGRAASFFIQPEEYSVQAFTSRVLNDDK